MDRAVNATATVITDLAKNKILKAHAGLAELPAIKQIEQPQHHQLRTMLCRVSC